MVEQNLSSKTRYFIEKDYICLVIWRAGEVIRALEDSLNVGIDINKKNGEVVVMETRCEEVKKVIEENLSSCAMSFFIEKDHSFLLIGRDGKPIHSCT